MYCEPFEVIVSKYLYRNVSELYMLKHCTDIFKDMEDNKLTSEEGYQVFHEDVLLKNLFDDYSFYDQMKANIPNQIAIPPSSIVYTLVSFNDEHILAELWTNIAFFVASNDPLFDNMFFELFTDSYDAYIIGKNAPEKNSHRFQCDICYENKQLYTGCSECNNNFICGDCYLALPVKNQCPFCRCSHMIQEVYVSTQIHEEPFVELYRAMMYKRTNRDQLHEHMLNRMLYD